jgi:hypothetical protein
VQLLVDYIAHYRDYHRIVVINPYHGQARNHFSFVTGGFFRTLHTKDYRINQTRLRPTAAHCRPTTDERERMENEVCPEHVLPLLRLFILSSPPVFLLFMLCEKRYHRHPLWRKISLKSACEARQNNGKQRHLRCCAPKELSFTR